MNKDILYPLRRLHGKVHDYLQLKSFYLKQVKAYQKSKTPFVFLVLTPEHRNLGDHAIAYSEKELLKRTGISYIEITGKQLHALKSHNLLGVMDGYPILINGGGNLGTLWMNIERLQRAILSANPNSDVMFLPNTIFYEPSDWGKDELQKSIKLYNKHKHLTIYAREIISYEFMKSIYKDVRIVPDMVMSLQPNNPEKDRHGCLLCLRGDCEKTRTEEQEQILRQQVLQLFGDDVCDTDMIAKEPVAVEQRKTAIQEKFDEFASAELVITDRLHGMIFCAITGTPCIVVDSKSPKVRGCYEWIKHLDYIRVADNVADIVEEYKKIPQTEHVYDNFHLMHYYEELVKDIRRIL